MVIVYDNCGSLDTKNMFFKTLKQKAVTDTYFSIFCSHVAQTRSQNISISNTEFLGFVLENMCHELKLDEEIIEHAGKKINVTVHKMIKDIEKSVEPDKHLVAVVELWRMMKIKDALYVAGKDFSERVKAMFRSVMTYEEAKKEILESYNKSKAKYTKKFPDIMKIYAN